MSLLSIVQQEVILTPISIMLVTCAMLSVTCRCGLLTCLWASPSLLLAGFCHSLSKNQSFISCDSVWSGSKHNKEFDLPRVHNIQTTPTKCKIWKFLKNLGEKYHVRAWYNYPVWTKKTIVFPILNNIGVLWNYEESFSFILHVVPLIAHHTYHVDLSAPSPVSSLIFRFS